ncbi:NADH-quinone oxidoreductase subunit NuoG [Ferribacterium limneticum]|uniref:NADH-quinone oxidoreductase subunit NuoG n=1 Tax=Ferribacterium limneticum TaxID=76259 RepID=UPI001CFBBBA7|nr:NADH-quinone oxidoreductase subunit NuoG [Ferribacterium limneticum]UCV27461.1 NADH-quinone oxidoreductase subunit NuoG [Ferribacterium limneticum]UCV31378.1 NADH-quinone oxidoreductase subunit NuoG [Ferribacterium limneticum]
MLEIEIDGKKAQVPDGSTVMDAAQQVGVYIPHFCYHKKLSIAANCRMCLVQVEKAPKPLPACATPVTNGMKVFTHSELAVKAQKGVMEFLLINHPLDCPICDQGGECQLQDMSVGYGPMKSRYTEEKHVVFHKSVGPLISMEEMSRCIHCTRCVRFGQEIGGIMELGMANRNMHSEIMTFVGRTVDSELSGNMIDLCPVGALTSKPFRYTARSWELQRRKSVSPHDSVGANLVVQVKHDNVMRVLPRENEEVNECWISDKERFSYQALNSDERLTKPMVKQGGEWKEVDWNVALDYVAHGLKDVAREQGGDALAALAAQSSTLEELFLLGKVMKGLGSGNMDFRPRQSDFSSDFKRAGTPWLGMRLAEIKDLDGALVVGSFLRKDHPLIAQRLRQAAKKFTKVSLLSVTGDDQLINFHARLIVAPSQLAGALAAVVKAAAEIKGVTIPLGVESAVICETSKKIAQSLVDGEKRAVFLGNVATQSTDATQLHALALALGKLTGAVVGFLGEGANTIGGYVASALPSVANARQMFEQPRKAYVLMGVEPELDCANPQLVMGALKQASLVVYMSAFKHAPALKFADVMLPIAPYTETSGTFINTEGRVQSFNGVVKARGDARPAWKLLRVLGNVLNLDGFGYTSSEEIRDEVLGKGCEFVTGLNNELNGVAITLPSVVANGLQRIADVPINFADPMARRAPALQQTADAVAPTARISEQTLAQIGIAENALVRVRQGAGEAVLVAKVDNNVPAGCVRVSAAHASTVMLGDMFGSISVERA